MQRLHQKAKNALHHYQYLEKEGARDEDQEPNDGKYEA